MRYIQYINKLPDQSLSMNPAQLDPCYSRYMGVLDLKTSHMISTPPTFRSAMAREKLRHHYQVHWSALY